MAGYRWTPPPGFSSFTWNGKDYAPGDVIPMPKAVAEHHARFGGHTFEEIEVAPPAFGSAELADAGKPKPESK